MLSKLLHKFMIKELNMNHKYQLLLSEIQWVLMNLWFSFLLQNLKLED